MDSTIIQEALSLESSRNESGPSSIGRMVRPFTEKQLLYLYPVDELDNNEEFIDAFLQVSCSSLMISFLPYCPSGMYKSPGNRILYKVG